MIPRNVCIGSLHGSLIKLAVELEKSEEAQFVWVNDRGDVHRLLPASKIIPAAWEVGPFAAKTSAAHFLVALEDFRRNREYWVPPDRLGRGAVRAHPPAWA